MTENQKYSCASEKKDDGGRAFPTQFSGGMTLRDWFAGMALQGCLSFHTEEDRVNITNEARHLNISPASYVASIAFKIADAMLIERNK